MISYLSTGETYITGQYESSLNPINVGSYVVWQTTFFSAECPIIGIDLHKTWLCLLTDTYVMIFHSPNL